MRRAGELIVLLLMTSPFVFIYRQPFVTEKKRLDRGTSVLGIG